MNTIRMAEVMSPVIRGSIVALYNSGSKEFNIIFGEEDGPYLWQKFQSKNKNEGDFICYLDRDNLIKLTSYVLKNLSKL